MATPLPFSFEIVVCSRYETIIWATFLIFLEGLIRVIIKTGTSKMSFVMVETCQIFLFDDYYCKNAILWHRKVHFSTKKQKDVICDGIFQMLTDENVWNVFIFLNLPLVHTSVSGVERNNSSDSGCHSDKDDGVTTSQAAMGALKLQTSKLTVRNRVGNRLGPSNIY